MRLSVIQVAILTSTMTFGTSPSLPDGYRTQVPTRGELCEAAYLPCLTPVRLQPRISRNSFVPAVECLDS